MKITSNLLLLPILIFLSWFSTLTFAQNLNKEESFKFVIKPTFEAVGSFHEGMSSVKINHKWGFIDKTGKVVIEPQFNPWQAQFNSIFSDGLVAVNFTSGSDENSKIDGNNVANVKWGFADKSGKIVIPPMFMGDYFDPPYFKEGLASVMSSSMFPNSQLLLTVHRAHSSVNSL